MKIEEMILKNRADCSGCSACANACPKKCVTMRRDDEGFAYPQIDHEICVQCGKCDATCPALNFKSTMPAKLPEVFATIHPDQKVRRHSSSGGTFTALSEIIFRDGGIIFGAGFNENWQVVHTAAENFDELENLRGSKYVQSQIGDVYRRVKVELENGRQVLFSGTPCQCAGLKSFLGKDYSNLLTVDLICHGTPSPFLWEKYLEHIAQGHDIARVNFRSKRFGWVNNHLEITFYDCGYWAGANINDVYLCHFLNGVIERPSCHECKFKFPNGKSDITIGDAWGVQNFAPKMFDNRGTSLVIVHTDKGKNFFSKTEMLKQPLNFDVVPMTNPMFLTSSIPDARRQDFFNDLKKFPSLAVVIMQKYFQINHNQINQSGRNLGAEIAQKYSMVLTGISRQRKHNLIFITSTLEKKFIDTLTASATRDFPESGIYFLNMQKDGKILLIDGRHPIIKMEVPPTFESLKKLFDDFHITNIFVEGKLKLGRESEKFLHDSGLRINKFEVG